MSGRSITMATQTAKAPYKRAVLMKLRKTINAAAPKATEGIGYA